MTRTRKKEMAEGLSAVIEPLIKRKIFATEEEAVRELLTDYILRQIAALQKEIGRLERKYGMRFERFDAYLHQRAALLETSDLSPEQRHALGRAVVQEEDDWLDWKASREMLGNWLGLRQEILT